MAKHLLSAGYYFPQPAHDMYGLGLLLFCACGGQLPKGHLDAISNGSTQRHASKLCGSGHSTAYLGQVRSDLTPQATALLPMLTSSTHLCSPHQ